MTENDPPPNGFMVQGTEAFKVAQAIYHTVTGKTETLSKSFSQNFKVTIEDLQQLHAKCEQMCGQWKIIEKNENITIQHIDDNKAVFSSVDRLKIYDKSQTSPIESISYELNILAQLPNIEKPQPYKITVRILSSIAMYKKMADDMPPAPLFRLFRGGNIVVEVEYVDYVVARNIISTIDSWVREIETPGHGRVLRFMQQQSHWVPRLISMVIFFLSAIAVIASADVVLGDSSNDQLLAKFLLASFSFLVIASSLAGFIGRFVESSIDRIREISCIIINRGDERLLTDYKKQNSFSIVKAIISVALVIMQGVFTGVLVSFILQLIK